MTYELTSPEAVSPPTLEGNIAYWEQRVDRLAAEMPSIAGSKKIPEWYYTDTERLGDIVPQLKSEGADLSNVSKYYELLTKESELKSEIFGYLQFGHPIQQLAGRLGEDFLGKVLRVEPLDGAIHNAMLDDLTQAAEQTGTPSLRTELNVLKEAYGLQTATELLGIGGDDYSDKLRELLLQGKTIGSLRFLDEERDDNFKWPEMQKAALTWMSKAVEAASGMSASEAVDYVFTASRHGSNEDIVSTIKKFDHFGIERIRELAKGTGIHGLEAYSIEQLELMEEFVHNPSKVAERLAGHDVITVMVNRVGDYSGVMRDVAYSFDDETKRVLFFEINRINDIYRRMVMLHKAGVNPSTLVLAAHSSPGKFVVSDVREEAAQKRDIATIAGRKLVAMMNTGGEPSPGDFSYSMHGMKGMAQLVESYMQPSRAIDDDDADAGRKKIIFISCHSASEVDTGENDGGDNIAKNGMQSVISQLGSDLIKSGLKSNVDIYGAPGGAQIQRNGHGVHYTGTPETVAQISKGRPRLVAQRIRIENGNLTKQKVQNITLRK
jgi:hypothetical protein